VGILAVVLLVGIVVAVKWNPETDLSLEAGKRLMELIFIVIAGALIAYLIDTMKRRRESFARDRAFRSESILQLLSKIQEIYRSVRKERRRLRLHVGCSADHPVRTVEYLEAMASLNELQLSLEELRAEAEVFQDMLDDDGAVHRALHEMDYYLSCIEGELEERATGLGDTVDPTLPEFKELRGFTIRRQDKLSTFGRFASPYDSARRLLLPALCNTQLRDEVRARPTASSAVASTGR
jgi:hypothetical protein